jgi:hypothetical protein
MVLNSILHMQTLDRLNRQTFQIAYRWMHNHFNDHVYLYLCFKNWGVVVQTKRGFFFLQFRDPDMEVMKLIIHNWTWKRKLFIKFIITMMKSEKMQKHKKEERGKIIEIETDSLNNVQFVTMQLYIVLVILTNSHSF